MSPSTNDPPDAAVSPQEPSEAPAPLDGTDSAVTGILPPYLAKDWQTLRAHLHAAADQCAIAARTATPEVVRAAIGVASMELMDASYWLELIQRKGQADDPR